MRIAAAQLEVDSDESITAFYNERVTDCLFLSDPTHYEYPRAEWILSHDFSRATVLEVGCGNGGLTRSLAASAERVVALDVSRPSLEELARLGLRNVTPVLGLVERYEPDLRFDRIVLSEVLEHLRRPKAVIDRILTWLRPGGSILLTTPLGHWDSNEHLHEFDLASFERVLSHRSIERLTVGYLRDRHGSRRWLVGRAEIARE